MMGALWKSDESMRCGSAPLWHFRSLLIRGSQFSSSVSRFRFVALPRELHDVYATLEIDRWNLRGDEKSARRDFSMRLDGSGALVSAGLGRS